MRADRTGAPEWITRRARKGGNPGLAVGVMIGVLASMVALNMAGQAFKQSSTRPLAQSRHQPQAAPVAQISRARPEAAPWSDRGRSVEQVRREAVSLVWQSDQPAVSAAPTTRQTVFNDQNYLPRGADNVVSLREGYKPVETEKPAGKVRVTIVEQTPSMKVRACWPLKEGSIERRNCRFRVGLQYRD